MGNNHMLAFVVKRMLGLMPVILVVSIAVFQLPRLSPPRPRGRDRRRHRRKLAGSDADVRLRSRLPSGGIDRQRI
ncbi:binding protein-protein-dependent transport system inner membrane component [Rhizobium freirei PRF 81]|uniref:Binding protein-protein-dependent transport system inner membrane component n=1 Tax=Rhizobium freirei PRF 81 TaxID=363754 RepID=N6U251_9HYPH|nr:binding protein-protein-dependent transport system inner membrane component [Rhizobium freirei PRF 81]